MANKTLNTRQKPVFQLPQQKPVQKETHKPKGKKQKMKIQKPPGY